MRSILKFGPIVLILLLAAYLRWSNLGGDPLAMDDSVISLKAIGLARHGQWTLLGTVMSVGFWHSPLSVYLYAIPYSLSPDPRIARLFTGAWNTVAVALVYFIGVRFFSRPAGIVAALLYAVHPEAVGTGRGIWNPNLGAPFIMLYVATGLLGYCRDRRWARILHLPSLSLGVQCHPGAALLAPITAVLMFHALRSNSTRRRSIMWHTALSGMLAALTLLPWGAGLYLAAQAGGLQAEINTLPNRGLVYTVTTIYEGLGYWRKHFSQIIVPALVIVGSLWLAARSLRRRDGVPGLVAVMGFFLVPALALVLNAKYRGFYLTSSFPNAFLIQGALIGGVATGARVGGRGSKFWNWRGLLHTPFVRWSVPPLVSFIVGLHLIYAFTPPESIFGPRHTLDEQIGALRTAEQMAAVSGREVLLLANDTGLEPPYPWELLNEGHSSRVIWHGRPLPLPPNGAVMMGFADDDSWPSIFTGGQMFGSYFRIVDVPPASHFQPDLVPPKPIRLANGTTLIGFLSQSPGDLPRPNQLWTVYLLWRVDTPNGEDFTIFVHLIDSNGDKYAQLDVPGLPAGHQRAGEYALSRLDFQLGDEFPSNGPLYFRVGMYDSTQQFSVLDDDGNVVGDYALVQIRGQPEPLARWENGITLDSLTTNAPLLQGPPLDVWVTWRVQKTPDRDLHLRWRVVGSRGAAVFETNANLDPVLAPSQLLAGAFVTEHYSLRIPTDILAGAYSLELQWTDSDGNAVGAAYSTNIEILARDRRFDTPEMAQVVEARFGEAIKLLGFDSQVDGRMLRLALYWRAIGHIERDYKYFVHVWRGGEVVAQSDSMPGAYQYLTSWWAPDEVFSETVSLDLSALEAGEYTLTTGFYDPATNVRLPVTLSDGAQPPDAWVTLQTITLK